jgi:hypothetical protein
LQDEGPQDGVGPSEATTPKADGADTSPPEAATPEA